MEQKQGCVAEPSKVRYYVKRQPIIEHVTLINRSVDQVEVPQKPDDVAELESDQYGRLRAQLPPKQVGLAAASQHLIVVLSRVVDERDVCACHEDEESEEAVASHFPP